MLATVYCGKALLGQYRFSILPQPGQPIIIGAVRFYIKVVVQEDSGAITVYV